MTPPATTPRERHPVLKAVPARMIEELRDELVDRALQMRFVADHVEQLRNVENPRATKRMVRRLRAGADRADAIASAQRATSIELLEALTRATELQEGGSEFLVRDGVRRILPRDQFQAVSNSAVLIGQLAKAGLGDVMLDLQSRAEPGSGRQRLQIFNPLHALTPAITAGHLWAREHLSPGEQEREALAQRLADAIVGDELLCGPINPAVTAVVEQTTHALSSSALVWLREADESQVAALDERARDLIPTLDGCELDPSTIEFWVHLGARSGELRMLLDQAGFARLDTCNAPELLEALAPDRYDTCDAS